MSYDSIIIGNSPTVYWELNDIGSSNPLSIADTSGNGHTGTLTATIAYNAGQPSLLIGDPTSTSIQFLDTCISATVPTNGTEDFALEIWFETTNASDQMVIMGLVTSGANIQINGGQIFGFIGSTTLTGTSVHDGVPHYAALIRRGSTAYLRLDGSQIATASDTTNLGTTDTLDVGGIGTAYYFRGTGASSTDGCLQKTALYNGTLTDAQSLAHYNSGATGGSSATITEQNLPSNHNGNITVHAVGTGTSWSSSTTWTPSVVSGWTVASKTFVDTTHYTIVLTPPSVATPPAGSTGNLTLTEGVTGSTSPSITIGTPTLTVSPTVGGINSTPSITLTGTNTIWSSETAAGLFTVSAGGTGASVSTPTISTNTGGTATLTVGSTTGTLTIKDTSTGATTSFTANSTAIAPLTNTNIAPCGIFGDGYTIDRESVSPKSLQAGWDFTFTGNVLSMGIANLLGGVGLSVTVDGTTTTPSMPTQSTTAWPSPTSIWSGSQGTHTVQIRFSGTGPQHYIAVDTANAFIANGTTPAFGPPANTGPTYTINQAPFIRHSAREGVWENGFSDLITGVDGPTLCVAGSDQVGQVLRWRGTATKIRLRGFRGGDAVISFLQDGVAGAPFAVSTDANDIYGWFDLGTPTDTSGDHEYGMILNTGAISLFEVQMCGGSLNTTASFPQRGNLVGFGDSKMVGGGIWQGQPGGYDLGRSYLYRSAQATNRSVLNMAASGTTLLTSAIGSAPPYQTDVIGSYLALLSNGWDATQDVIIWELGFNDAQRIIDGTTQSYTAWSDALAKKLTILAATGATIFVYAIPASSSNSSVNTGVTTITYSAALNTVTANVISGLGLSNVHYKTGTITGTFAINGTINPDYATPGAGDTQDHIHLNTHGESNMVSILSADVSSWTPTATSGLLRLSLNGGF